MTKDEFSRLFSDALNHAAISAEARLGIKIPRSFVIQFHGLGFTGHEISVATASDNLYRGENLFFKIVDIAVVSFTNKDATIFVRVSGHSPVSFEETWNPREFGPFKLIEPAQILDLRNSETSN